MNELIDYLKKEFQVEALILCGSRCVGDYKENSYWDMNAFVKNPKKINKIPKLEGVDIDCSFHSIYTKYSWKEFNKKLRFSEVVFDNKNKIANKIRNQAFKVYDKGPAKWNKKIALAKIEKVQRYENKFKDCLKYGKLGELFQRIAWHYLENTYVWWYGVRGEWEPRGQQMFEDIKKRDPKFYSHLRKIFTSTSNEEKVNALHQLHKYFFESNENSN